MRAGITLDQVLGLMYDHLQKSQQLPTLFRAKCSHTYIMLYTLLYLTLCSLQLSIDSCLQLQKCQSISNKFKTLSNSKRVYSGKDFLHSTGDWVNYYICSCFFVLVGSLLLNISKAILKNTFN